eukprot:scaffold6.g2521.t1
MQAIHCAPVGVENRTPRKALREPAVNMATADSRPGSASLPVRPVTARTWQALMTEDAGKRVSVYTNDLFGQGASEAAAAIDASSRYQPASARPATPRTAEQQQQQQQAAAGQPPSRLSVPRGSGEVAASSPTGERAGQAAGGSAPSALGASLLRPSTAPAARGGSPSPLRTSAFALTSLAGGGGGSPGQWPSTPARALIAVDSPRLKQLLGQNFASAVSAGTAAVVAAAPPAAGAPREAGGLRAQWQGARPATPSFQPLSARPATALGGGGGGPDGEDFTIRAAFHGSANDPQGPAPRALGPTGAYPTPPATAPAKARVALALGGGDHAPGGGQQPEAKTGFAAFGINPASFVAPGPRTGAGPGAATAPLAPPLLGALLASAALAHEAGLRAFVLAPGPADRALQCRIIRSRGGLLKGGPQYRLELEGGGGGAVRFLLAARKRSAGAGGARYAISCSQARAALSVRVCVGGGSPASAAALLSASLVRAPSRRRGPHPPLAQDAAGRRGPGRLAKLRSNFLGTEFVAAGQTTAEVGAAAGELAAVTYATNVLGTKGPRRMTALLPKLAPGGARPLALAPAAEAESLLGQYRQYALADCVVLRNKPPRWNEGLGAYCLSFGGRVTQASVKNFQLVAVDNMERTVLQFGKVSDEVFTMDYSYPMTALQARLLQGGRRGGPLPRRLRRARLPPVRVAVPGLRPPRPPPRAPAPAPPQAFAICLSSFDSKLACE